MLCAPLAKLVSAEDGPHMLDTCLVIVRGSRESELGEKCDEFVGHGIENQTPVAVLLRPCLEVKDSVPHANDKLLATGMDVLLKGNSYCDCFFKSCEIQDSLAARPCEQLPRAGIPLARCLSPVIRVGVQRLL